MREKTLVQLLCAALLAPSLSHAQGSPPESLPISPAASVHLSRQGLDALGDAIAGIVPKSISATGLAGQFVCDEATGDTLNYAADDITIRLSADDVSVTPLENRLEIHLGLTLYSDPADITLNGTCFLELDEVCNLALPPTPLEADVGIQVVLQDGALLTNVTGIDITYGNFGNPVGTGCLIGDALETLNGYGVDLIGSVLDTVLSDQLDGLETQLEDILAGLTTALAFDTELDLLGSTLGIRLAASELQIDSQGLRLDFEAQFTTPNYGTCVPESGPYQATAHDPPAMTGFIPGVDVPYHAGIVVSQDLLNQAIYVAWQGGLLCLRLSDLVDLEIDTGYLSLIDQELVEELWPETKVLDLRIGAEFPPVVVFEDVPRLDAELSLDVYGEEMGRDTRFWGHGLFADAGVGLELVDGTLVIDVDFDLETRLGITVLYNEWLPQAIPEGFAGLIPNLAGQFVNLDELVPSFGIPSIYGLTLADLDMRVVGDADDYLGLYAWIDPTAAEAIEIPDIDLSGAGCGEDGCSGGGDIGDIIVIPGCEDGGCGADSGLEGCDSSGGGCGGCGDAGGDSSCGTCSAGKGYRVGARTAMVAMLPILLFRRRRR